MKIPQASCCRLLFAACLLFIVNASSFSQACINFSKISSGSTAQHFVAIKPDGSLWAWGYNSDGQLGDGTTTNSNTPIQVGSATDWKFVATGAGHTAAIKTDGTLWTWGSNSHGQLGLGGPSGSQRTTPVQVGTATDWATVSVGANNTMAIKTDGSLWGWGSGSHGELGNGTNSFSNSPIRIGTDNDWKTVVCGFFFTMAIKTDNSLWATGMNSYGQLGLGHTFDVNVFLEVWGISSVASVSLGGSHTLAIKTNGTLWSWGFNFYGQLGIPGPNLTEPYQVAGGTGWKSVSCGGDYTLATKTNGSLWAWGDNSVGQNGNGTFITTNAALTAPQQIGTATDWGFISASKKSSAAFKTNGTFWEWGYNFNGELGNGNNISQNVPTAIAAKPIAPLVATPLYYAQGATPGSLSATGNNLLWYTTASGGSGSSVAPVPSASSWGTTSYWVTQSAGSCESDRAKTDVIISSASHLNFDGVDDYVVSDFSPTSSTEDFTYEAWIRPTQLGPGNKRVLMRGIDATGGWSAELTVTPTGQIQAGITKTSPLQSIFAISPAVISVSTWHHVAMVFKNGNAISLYLDGVLQASTLLGVIPVTLRSSDNLIRIGQGNLPSEQFKGDIDEVRVWNTALPASTISSRMNCELQGNEAGLVLYYKFNQGNAGSNNGSETFANDETANFNFGTLVSFALTGTSSNWLYTTSSPIPVVPQTGPLGFCDISNAAVANLSPAPSATVKWYNAPTGGAALSPGILLANGTYFAAGTNVSGCESGRTPVTVTISAHTLATTNQTTIVSVTGNTNFPFCTNLFATVNPDGASPLSGNTTAKLWIENTQPAQYVKRHFEITPSTGASTATGSVTLYFTQAEFDAFNAVNTIKLPAGPADAIGKSNLIIEKRSGVSSNGTGLPNTYTGGITIIDPADANIVWNAGRSRWEVTFNVTGFSGFFVKTTGLTLPVHWLSINGDLNTQKQAVINWQVEETDVAFYEVEKSMDGRSFNIIGKINSKGHGTNGYQLTEVNSLTGIAYYRIKQTDNSGSFRYSSVIKLQATETIITEAYPNPFENNVTIKSSKTQSATLIDASGKTVRSFLLNKGTNFISTSMLNSGFYFLKTDGGEFIKLVKR